MERSETPVQQDLVLVGGGHSHVTVLKRFGMRPEPGVRLTLISRDAHAPYSGMLPGLIAGHYEFDDAHIDLGPLSRFAGARFLHDEVVGLDLQARQVICRDRPPVAYDLLSINTGSTPRMRDVYGAEGVVVPVKPIDSFGRRWASMCRKLLDRTEPTVVAAVGAGAGGVELLLAVQYRLRQELKRVGRDDSYLRYRIYTKTDEILPTHNKRVRRRFRRVLQERGVDVFTEHTVASAERRAGSVRLSFDGGARADVDEVLWVTTAGAHAWPGEAGLQVDDAGFIEVDDTLQSINTPGVFASGDIAHVVNHPRPKAGVFAVRQGPPLEQNLRRVLHGQRPRPFAPQKEFLSLVSTGDKHAVASRSAWALEGAWVWTWKDWIDRRFMARFNELPEMDGNAPSTAGPDDLGLDDLRSVAMRCAGCGSKVGSEVLGRVLDRLRADGLAGAVGSDGIVIGLEAPDDAAAIRVPEGRLAVQTIDAFRAFIDDPWMFGRITAVHALGDLWAMGAAPHSALAIATVPYAREGKIEADLYQLLAGAVTALDQAGAVLVGGHTNEGPEMALGFALTGFADSSELTRKSGARPGQALVLTKPLGTGVIFAADMRRRAKGRWVESALRSMAAPAGAAADLLRQHGATAMTDVTGFGLIGHLVEIIEASGVGAELDLDAVPILPGALELTAAGIFSSLQPENLRLQHVIANGQEGVDHPAYPFLFDPQTAGGLLATVPDAQVGRLLAELRAAGVEGVQIGRIVEGETTIIFA